jgi:hypothetical protein
MIPAGDYRYAKRLWHPFAPMLEVDSLCADAANIPAASTATSRNEMSRHWIGYYPSGTMKALMHAVKSAGGEGMGSGPDVTTFSRKSSRRPAS